MAEDDAYIDYDTFLDPDFSPTAFANKLVLQTNNPSDTPLDLSTPLSRVLFDIQEIDTHIDTLTTRSALPLLEHSTDNVNAGNRVLEEVEGQVAQLTAAYKALEKEVIERHEVAEQVRVTAERLVETVRIGRTVGRCLMLGRQLEVQIAEVGQHGAMSAKREDHRAMVRSSNTLLSLRQVFAATGSGQEGEELDRINIIASLKNDLVGPAERTIVSRSQQIVREFSMSSLAAGSGIGQAGGTTSTFTQTEDMKSKATSALMSLYLLSPVRTSEAVFEPSLLTSALQDYLQTALRSSTAALSRALATLPGLDRALLEISARCQNLVALEALLESTKPPPHLLLTSQPSPDAAMKAPPNFLQPLLHSLDTSSLPSYFWRSLASSMSSRVQEIVNRGGVSARTLRSNKERVREAVRECVNRGSQPPSGGLGKSKASAGGSWEREAAVMVGSIVGPLGR